MLSVDEALRLVLDHAQTLRPAPVALAAAQGRLLAEPIVSDIDSPPHDKSLVDGYAVIAADIAAAGVELDILEEITAGEAPTRTVEPGAATRIMTGAPLPAGADAVVMVEQTETTGARVRIAQMPVKSGQNIMRRAAAMSRGQAVLPPGKLLRPAEIGLLAEVGRIEVCVVSQPSVAVVATGNELVEPASLPKYSQIRNSNGPMLAALARQSGALALELGIGRDDEDDLRRRLLSGLNHDVLAISGGVSAGVLDLVPKVLAQLGVEQVFHKVNLKPGKPLWFGVRRHADGKQTLVFGLPGNPVSSLVCFELFVRPAIQKLRGLPPTGLARITAQLTMDHQQRGDRPTYWPAANGGVAVGGAADHGDAATTDSAVVRFANHRHPSVTPLPWKGSGDLRTLADADCLAFFPAGDRLFQAGESIAVLLLDESRC